MKLVPTDQMQSMTQLSALKQMQAMTNEAKNLAPFNEANQIPSDFSNLLSSTINKVNALQKTSGELAQHFELGDKNVSLADVMIARNKASIAFEATVQVRNKLLEAYKELINMPV